MSGKRSPGPWYSVSRTLTILEAGAKAAYPTLRRRRRYVSDRGVGGLVYVLTIDVLGYESRRVEIVFPRGLTAESVKVSVDGPDESPHRFGDGSLCLWFPRDPADRRWTVDKGLLALLDLIAQHLFKEAHWRETDEWLGPEVRHQAPKLETADVA